MLTFTNILNSVEKSTALLVFSVFARPCLSLKMSVLKTAAMIAAATSTYCIVRSEITNISYDYDKENALSAVMLLGMYQINDMFFGAIHNFDEDY